MTFHAKLFPLKKNLGSIPSIHTEVGSKRSIQSKWYEKPSWGQHFNLKEYRVELSSFGVTHWLEAVIRLHWNMPWSFGTCFTQGVEICHMKPGTCANVGRIHAFLIARQRKNILFLLPIYNTRFCFLFSFLLPFSVVFFLSGLLEGTAHTPSVRSVDLHKSSILFPIASFLSFFVFFLLTHKW